MGQEKIIDVLPEEDVKDLQKEIFKNYGLAAIGAILVAIPPLVKHSWPLFLFGEGGVGVFIAATKWLENRIDRISTYRRE